MAAGRTQTGTEREKKHGRCAHWMKQDTLDEGDGAWVTEDHGSHVDNGGPRGPRTLNGTLMARDVEKSGRGRRGEESGATSQPLLTPVQSNPVLNATWDPERSSAAKGRRCVPPLRVSQRSVMRRRLLARCWRRAHGRGVFATTRDLAGGD